MALRLPARAVRRTGSLILVGVALTALPGCMNGVPNRLEFSDTQKEKITEVAVGQGSSGDVTVRMTAGIAETRIKRVVQYRGDEPTAVPFRLDGTVLRIDTDCGNNCSVSYDIETPTSVKVSGTLSSGDVTLTDVAGAEFTLSSGDLQLTRATGMVRLEVTSGNIAVTDVPGAMELIATSGDIRGSGLGGGAINAEATSGDIDLDLVKPGSVTAHVSSGEVTVRVPAGPYRVAASASSGDANIGINSDPAATNVLDLKADSGDVNLWPR